MRMSVMTAAAAASAPRKPATATAAAVAVTATTAAVAVARNLTGWSAQLRRYSHRTCKLVIGRAAVLRAGALGVNEESRQGSCWPPQSSGGGERWQLKRTPTRGPDAHPWTGGGTAQKFERAL